MKLEEKLYKQMILLNLTQQALARKAGVSDSEVSRLLHGQSKRPGLQNVARLAKALEVSLDYLADDSLDEDPFGPATALSDAERALLDRARELGIREALMVLDATRIQGFDLAIRRLYGLSVDAPAPKPPPPAQPPPIIETSSDADSGGSTEAPRGPNDAPGPEAP